jgi:mitotic spindle assembly checkpoint protein MAD2B
MPSVLNGISVDNTMTASQLSQYFRSFLIRLGLLESYLGVIPTDWDPTFAIVLEMKDGEIPEEPLTKVIFALGT